jgi:hypothetical protein
MIGVSCNPYKNTGPITWEVVNEGSSNFLYFIVVAKIVTVMEGRI